MELVTILLLQKNQENLHLKLINLLWIELQMQKKCKKYLVKYLINFQMKVVSNLKISLLNLIKI